VTELIGWLTDPASWQGGTGIPFRMAEHIAIAALSILAAALVALPVGLWIGHTGRGAGIAINVSNVGRALPSYAVIVMILPISLAVSPDYGLDLIPTFIAMVILAIPPILISSFAGLQAVDRDLLEAGRGMGLTERQVLRDLELPLAAPVIIGGFRTATLNVIATATIGAVVGFGGLGAFILGGRAKGISGLGELIGGALLVTILAIVVDLALAWLQRRAARRADRTMGPARGFRDLSEIPVPQFIP
jgi:osmoprotectant transport system permease protein